MKNAISVDELTSSKNQVPEGLTAEVEKFKLSLVSDVTDVSYNFLRFSANIHQLLTAIRYAELQGTEPEVIREAVGSVREILSASQIIHRMQTWPRGYPGDFETIEILCNGVTENVPDIGIQQFDNILLLSPTAQQHRNKVAWQGHQLLSAVNAKPGARLLSVACGGSRDLLTVAPYLAGRDFYLCLNDSDKDALELSCRRMNGITENLSVVHGSVFSSIRKLVNHGPFDVIVAGGLFDYLDDRQAVWLLTHLRKLLLPGGTLCFTNIASGIPYTGWLDYLANWKLISRTEPDIRRMVSSAGGTDPDKTSVERDTSGQTLLIRHTTVKKEQPLKSNLTSITILGEEARRINPAEKWNMLSSFIRHYGREAISYATLQQGMEYFINELGYVAFVTVQHPVLSPVAKRIVLCDPVCALSDYERFLQSFIDDNPHVAFGVISETCAEVLRKMGFRINCLGYETELSIQTYNTSGNWKDLDLIKRAKNEVQRKGISIEEVDITKVNRDELEAVSKKWLTQKKISDREIWIYARRPVFDHEEDMRKFVAFDAQGKVIGFVFYDPMYRDGKVVGYSANTPRTDEQQYTRLTTAIHMKAIDVFRNEGKEVLNLCLSPFVKLDLGKYNDDKAFKLFLEITARFGEGIYNFSGLSFHKSKYRGSEKPIYFATKSRLASNEMYLAFHAAGISKNYWSTFGELLKGAFKNIFRS
jgi:SAM-dependent methyltransferase